MSFVAYRLNLLFVVGQHDVLRDGKTVTVLDLRDLCLSTDHHLVN